MNPRYLGDSVMANWTGHGIVLSVRHNDSQKIYLNQEVFSNLQQFAADTKKEVLKAATEGNKDG